MKKLLLVFCLSLLTYSFIPIQKAKAETVTQIRYLGSYGFQHLSLDGNYFFGLRNLTSADIFDFYNKNHTGTYNGNIQIGFRAYHNVYDPEYYYITQYEELTTGVTLLYEIANNFEGWISTIWINPEINMSRLDCLQIDFWTRSKQSATVWSSWFMMLNDNGVGYNTAQLHTESLGMDKLLSNNWNFTFYLKCFRETIPSIKRVVRIYCGNSTYNSRIENMQFDNGLSNIDEMEQYESLAILGLACGVVALGVAVVLKK